MKQRDGTVTAFDFDAGHGRVRADDGDELFFHCTAIADGSRNIDVGARVSFLVVPGHHGRWEATDLVVRGGPAALRSPAPTVLGTDLHDGGG